jgi:hypothetical protein
MDKRIIYPTDQGGVAVIIPAPGCGLTIEQLARKDVPANVAYKIVDVADVPSDKTFRNAWEADFSNPDGHGVGADAWFAEQEQA